MKERLKLGLVGFGNRGTGLLQGVLIPMSEVDVDLCAVCDLYEDRAENAAKLVEEACGVRPLCTTDYHEVVNADVDAIIVMTAWESHIEIAIAAMKAGKPVAMEVGGAYSVEDCWDLVHTSEETGMPCMLLENCCYGKRELMVLNMVKRGLFGELVACEGGYLHDLREEVATGEEKRHYRLRNYLNYNRENYPTHELGPIAKVLGINDGNRMVSLVSMASCARGLNAYVADRYGAAHPLAAAEFKQGDVVKTVIRCAGGQLITLTLDTTLPRSYSRDFTVRGTKAAYFESNDSVFVDRQDEEFEFDGKGLWGSAEKYEEEYLHPLWKENNAFGGHGGMDGMVFRAFVESVKAGVRPPIDVYDTAAWMCISAISEKSIAEGGTPQEIPDFTGGRWENRTDIVPQKYSLKHIDR